MNVVNNENSLKESGNNCTKTPATANKYNKLGNNLPQIENPDYIENKIKIYQI